MKKIIFFIFIISLLGARNVFADVIFSEISWKGTSSGSTHEWIELYNESENIQNISGWTIKDQQNQLNIVIPNNSKIDGYGFYVIKRTTSDIVPFDLSVPFDGGLSDQGEKLILSDANGLQKQVLDFSAGWTDPNMNSSSTMQWDGSRWIVASPSPKSGDISRLVLPSDSSGENLQNNTVSQNNSTGGSSSSTQGEVKNKAIELQKFKTTLSVNQIFYVGIPEKFSANTAGYYGEPVLYGRYFFNFGDGSSKEIILGQNEKITHSYYYPGEYELTLSYFKNFYSDEPETVNKVKIKVVPTMISISKVGDEKDFYIELSNDSGYDIDISKWKIVSSEKSFIFPAGTNILAEGKIIISPKISGFSTSDQGTLKLKNSEEEIVFEFNPAKVSAKTSVTDFVPKAEKSLVSPQESISISNENPSTENISKEQNADLSAGAVLSQNNADKNPNSYLYFWSFVGILAVSVGAVYYIRRDKKVKNPGEDFDIIDE